ncbi:MBL fold metallo-hydrolase [Aquicoccus porphyridii]|uniref:MBL fold metallo-hydrolase n=1 Tax=Aquicoccus porphyridii TaxID=1852029 RepID=A0A5A9ZFL7_9RHOB|nr:MBL fold metallo-hydrolase [Aquicoccus porphyridii]KAA0916077.1 MBL fold metallo-hydrolase [Aquicoccus porphyridii]RAI52716.1 MBL fold metallo-hydrolase [Rhodobacteraceae bacterium AsT-22]
MAEMRFTILGCGSSGGVPRLGGHWGECDPTNPRNQRRRCSMLVERVEGDAITRILIDTSPDLRQQLLDAGVGELDGVIWTHSHADHVHGLDDLRMIVFNMRRRLPVWADGDTQNDLFSRFGYAFVQPEDSPYPPILDMHTIKGDVVIEGAGGAVTLSPFKVGHGAIDALGFRIGGLAYLPDVAEMTENAWEAVEGLDCWILDALRRTPHPTHSHLEQSLGWIERAAPKRAVLTNMHIDLDYATLEAETPGHITPAYDGMVLSFPA